MTSILGTTNQALHLDSADENRDTVVQLAQQARRQLDIFSQSLDPALYDNEAFERAVFDLARLHPSTRIRILVQDASTALQNGHRLLRLAQNLTSSVFIRKPAHDHREDQGAFIIADGVGYLHRVVGNIYSYNAVANFMSPQQAGKLNDYFNDVWEHASEDPQLRRLHV